MSDRPRILVKEQIADSGVDLLREHFDVDLGARLERRGVPRSACRSTTGS